MLFYFAAGLPPYEIDTPPQSPKVSRQTSVSRQTKPMKPVSYDEYHVLWKGIATSITKYERNNECKALAMYFMDTFWL